MTMERWRPGWGIIPWRPFREMEEMTRHFEDIFGRPLLPTTWKRLPTEMGWAPAIEIFEKEDKYVVKAELPGMKEEDIDVSVVGDTLTIKGERKAETEVKEENYYCCERSYGSFSRSIALPSTVDAKKITASYEEGVLEVSLPKAAEVKPAKVKVSAKKKASK
ncbi:MAG TPA: Hsp20/alpha crystallin family protein [Dehalococcoidia bacterium]|nr:Hsp20/alpha crystallin family protein [Dehalococcoidia bacterium]